MLKKVRNYFIIIALLSTAVLASCPQPDNNKKKNTDNSSKNFKAAPIFAINPGNQTLTYTWIDSTPAADSYDLYWKQGTFTDAEDVKTGTIIEDAISGGTINGLINNQTYSVMVRANKDGYNSIDTVVKQAVPSFKFEAFTAAPALSLTGGYKRITVTWTEAEPQAESYDIYWIEGVYSNEMLVKAGTKVSSASSGYVIYSLANSQSYSIVVTANKSGYNSINSEVKNEKTDEIEPPYDPNVDYTGPGNITFSNEGIKITWDAVSETDYYEIWRSGSRLGEYSLISYVTDASAYTDTNPNPVKYENYYKVKAIKNSAVISESKVIALEIKIFGEDTYFYDIKYDKISDITAEVNNIHDTWTWRSNNAHWTNRRFALYFKPGTYTYSGSMKIGFYTSANGLGAVPTDTKLFGSIECPPYLTNNGGTNVTQNFWRSIENLSIRAGTFQWSVSQAAPARRMHATVNSVFDWSGGWASGGFLSDSYFTGSVGSGSQQQFYTRNCYYGYQTFSGVAWNKTTQGSDGKIDTNSSTANRTYIETTPVIREKPFLYFDSDFNEYMVFVPAIRRDAVGVSWTENNIGEGNSLVLVKDFYIARPETDTAATINAALDEGKNVYFLPGRFELNVPLHVKYANTVVLGSGFTTLIPASGNTYGAIFVDDVDGVTIASLLFDALYNSAYLLCVGENGANKDHSQNPTLLADIFLRAGGVRANCNVDISALINSNNVIGDHFWAWRADHGTGVGWTSNTTKNGVVVTGDDVTLYGLFVEHYHEYEVLWLGENGSTYFYQNERPYDAPAGASWQNPNRTGTEGWASYKVANHVNKHFAAGLGMYSNFRNASWASSAMEVPNKPDVIIQNANTVALNATGGHRGQINGAGQSSNGSSGTRTYISSYINGVAVTPGANKTGTQPPDETFNIPTNLHP
ncbi:MAG: hypothetical protein FWH41_03900 [Treponema sp.]|nr:hypothetical protein [Treponema sp.]